MPSCHGLGTHLVCCDQTWDDGELRNRQLLHPDRGLAEGRMDSHPGTDRTLLELHSASMRLGLQREAHMALAANTHSGHSLAEASYHRHRAQAVVQDSLCHSPGSRRDPRLRAVPAQDADEHARLADVDLFVRWWYASELGVVMREEVDFGLNGLDSLCWR